MRATQYVHHALAEAFAALGLPLPEAASVEPPKDKKFGDLATNACLLAAKEARQNPRELAERVKAQIAAAGAQIERIDVAGPGFLNFTLSPAFWQGRLPEIIAAAGNYGTCDMGRGKKFQVEFVSANPTGPLHIGHGRGAAVGDSLARILAAAGFEVEREYYLNDAGRQMRLLGASIWARACEILGRAGQFPEDGYQGDYIKDHAQDLIAREGEAKLASLPHDEGVELAREFGMAEILAGIKADLAAFNVEHDVWFSERSLTEAGKVDETFADLKARGLAYEADGALWFKSTEFGDDKDRVLRKSTGELTYFASDIAYHDDKFKRGFDMVVDVWGADHHGYVPRMRSAVAALGKAREQFDVVLVQLVNLLRGGEQIAMSTRAGKFETLADVVNEVGADSARFIFLSRKSDSKLDFDLDLVKEQSMENPVYYVQYAHARINSVFAKAGDAGVAVPAPDAADLSRLDTPEDLDLVKCLERYPEAVEAAARTLSPHHVTYHLRELAGLLHRYYTVHHVLGSGDVELTGARLVLLAAVAQVVRNGLGLLGVSAPVKM